MRTRARVAARPPRAARTDSFLIPHTMASLFDPAHRTRFIFMHQAALLLTLPGVLQAPWITLLILLAPLTVLHRAQGRGRTTILLSIGTGVVLGVLGAALMVYALAYGLAGGRV